jgi:CheY-like chemotaxis protein
MPVTIVVADDAADYREVVRALLSPMSDTIVLVGEAEDGEQALALVRRERPDLVITDLIMPRLDGVELTRRIRQELPETKVIPVTANWPPLSAAFQPAARRPAAQRQFRPAATVLDREVCSHLVFWHTDCRRKIVNT